MQPLRAQTQNPHMSKPRRKAWELNPVTALPVLGKEAKPPRGVQTHSGTAEGKEREEEKMHFLKANSTRYFPLRIGHRGSKILTGWSASRSDPYISTRFAHLSKSEIFFGNQGTFSMSRVRMESTKLLIMASVLREEMLLSSMAMAVTSKIYKLKGS